MAMVLVATVAWSFAGLFTRLTTMDVYTAITSCIFSGGSLALAFLAARTGTGFIGGVRSLGRAERLAIFVSVIAGSATTPGLFLTSVTHVAAIYASCPFVAALIARLRLGLAVQGITIVSVIKGGAAHASACGSRSVLLLQALITFLAPVAYWPLQPDGGRMVSGRAGLKDMAEQSIKALWVTT